MRTRLQHFTAGAVTVVLMAASAISNAAFPEKPISIIVPFGAGGSTDAIARGLGTEMSKILGQNFATLNIGGAAGTIGTTRLSLAAKDGYTVGMIPVGPLTTQPHLLKLPYSADSFDYVCLAYTNPQAVIVRADSPFKTTAELIAWAKQNPGKLIYGSSGVGSVPHLAVVALAKAAGIEVTHVPHKGDADNMVSLLGGHVAMFVSHTAVLATHGASVRAIGLMANQRMKEYPELPTLAEQGAPALSFDVWGGLAVPKGTPAPVIAELEKACKQATSSDSFRKLLISLQTPFNFMDRKAFTSFVAAEYERNGRLLRDAGIQREQ